MRIYHITSKSHWMEARRNTSYAADSLATEGFIHCSTEEQLLPVAESFFAGQGGLVVLVMDADRVGAPVRWERSVQPPGVDESAVFPHVYGPIMLDAVVASADLEKNELGRFVMPTFPSETPATIGTR